MPGSRLVFLWSKPPSVHWIRAQHGKKICGDAKSGNALGLIATHDIEIRVSKRGEFDRFNAVTKINEVTKRGR